MVVSREEGWLAGWEVVNRREEDCSAGLEGLKEGVRSGLGRELGGEDTAGWILARVEGRDG